MEKSKKNIFMVFILCLCLVLVLLFCIVLGNREYFSLRTALLTYRLELAVKKSNSFTIEVFYVDPSILTRYPWRAEEVIDVCNHHSAPGNQYEDGRYPYGQYEYGSGCDELLMRLAKANIKKNENPEDMNARICFIIKNRQGKSRIEIVMQATRVFGPVDTVFINGVNVEYDDIFGQFYEELITPIVYGNYPLDWGDN